MLYRARSKHSYKNNITDSIEMNILPCPNHEKKTLQNQTYLASCILKMEYQVWKKKPHIDVKESIQADMFQHILQLWKYNRMIDVSSLPYSKNCRKQMFMWLEFHWSMPI